MEFFEYFTVCLLGASGYGAIEILWRGKTHWSMLLTGGLAFLCIYLIANYSRGSLIKKCLMCALTITIIEYLTGAIVNLALGWNVWDYSSLHFQLNGQIRLLYSVLWLALSLPGIWVSRRRSVKVLSSPRRVFRVITDPEQLQA